MIIRKTDNDGDFSYGKGLSDYCRNEAAVDENIKTRLLSWLNDCPFAMTDGVDYKNLLEKGQQANLLLALKTMILASYGVIGITAVTANLDANRNLSVSYNIDTIYGNNFNATIHNIVSQGA